MEDLPDLENSTFSDLPYFKFLNMPYWKPHHFRLKEWTRLFTIPDKMMQKIYHKDAWTDTEVPKTNEDVCLTEVQRAVLVNWLNKESPFRAELNDNDQVQERVTRAKADVPEDDLFEMLSDPNNWSKNGETCDIDKVKIAKCKDHEVVHESRIAERAIEKMDHLSSEQEEIIQKLMQDKEYMDFLDVHIKRFLDSHQK